MASFDVPYGGSAGGQYRLTMDVNLVSQNVANNTSTVSILLRMRKLTGSGYWNLNQTKWSANVNGQGYSGSFAYDFRNYSELTILHTTQVIPHNSDGTKTIGFSATHNAAIGSSITTASGSGSLTLPTIPRQANLTSAPNFNDEQNPTINYSNPAGNAVTQLVAGIFDNAGITALAGYRAISKTGSSYTFNLTTGERNALRAYTPNSNTATVRFYVRTLIGGVYYFSYLARTLTIINGNPVFQDFDYKDKNASVVSITGNNQVLVQGQSVLEVTIDSSDRMVAQKQANPVKYTFAIDSISLDQAYSNNTIVKEIGAIQSSGTKNLSIKAFDSRNNFTEVVKPVTVIPYAAPVVNATVQRENGFGEQTSLLISGLYSLVEVGGTPKNEVTGVRYRYREKGDEWGSWVNKTFTADDETGEITTSETLLSLNNEKEFEFEVEIIDRFGSTVVPLTLGIGRPILWIGANRTVAVNHKPESTTEGLHIPPGDALWDYIFPVGRRYVTTDSNENPNEMYRGTWTRSGSGPYTWERTA